MKDGVIKNDGTSRLIKANLPATYEEMRTMAAAGTLPADILFNDAGWDVLPDFLNKANLMKDQTATLFGLGPDAVPDDVFGLLSRFQKGLGNEYIWAKQLIYPGTESSASTVYSTQDTSGVAHLICYSASLPQPQKTESGQYRVGREQFENEIIVPYGEENNFLEQLQSELTNKYFILLSTGYPDSKWQYLYKSQDDSVVGLNGGRISFSNTKELSYSIVRFETVDYLNSPDPNAYLPTDNDGYTYTALGQLGSAFDRVKIAIVRYTGTGTYGYTDSCSAHIGFSPKLWFVHSQVGSTRYFQIVNHDELTPSYKAAGLFSANSSNTNCSYIVENGLQARYRDGAVQWYNSNSAQSQLNYSGGTYRITFIG